MKTTQQETVQNIQLMISKAGLIDKEKSLLTAQTIANAFGQLTGGISKIIK